MRAATAFAAAVQSDPSAACELLAPVTRERLEQEGGANCPAALEQAGLSDPGRVLGSTVAGHSAQVRFADDAMFLALFDDGWKVVAVGCRRPSPDRAVPYECDVEGS